MRTWRLIAHHQDPDSAISWFRNQRRIAIGWGRIGDLRPSGARTATDITAMIRDAYPELSNAHLGGPSLWRLYDEMRAGDLVIVSDGKRRRLVMRVEGEYQWDPRSSQVPPGDYQHWRPATLIREDPDELWQRSGAREASGENIRWTLARCDGSADTLGWTSRPKTVPTN